MSGVGFLFWLYNIVFLFFYMIYQKGLIEDLPYQKPEYQLIYFLKVLVLKIFKSLLTNIYWYLLFYLPHIIFFVHYPPSDTFYQYPIGEISHLKFFVTTYILTLLFALIIDNDNLSKKFNSES